MAFRHSLSQCVRRAWTCPVAGKSVLDAGAANGFFALLAALHGAERVYASFLPAAGDAVSRAALAEQCVLAGVAGDGS